MGRGGEVGVPVWGVEAGPGGIRAARVVRREEGGFYLLEYIEAKADGPGPEAAVSFLRRRGLKKHPLVIAIRSSSAHLSTVRLTPEEFSQSHDGMRLAILEHVHQEPELIDLRWSLLSDDTLLVCAEDRARVEGFLVSLEAAGVPTYSLVSDLDALLGLVRGLDLFSGDGVLVRVGPLSTDLFFLDGSSVQHLGLPLGSNNIEDEEALAVFGADVKKLIEYHRSRIPREGPERIVLLGLDDTAAERIIPHLPERPVTFPSDAGPVRGKGRISMARCLSILRIAPAAVGAAIAGASEPRRLDLSFRRFPDILPAPPPAAGSLLAASVLLWLALALVWFGTARELGSLREARQALIAPPIPRVSEETAGRILELIPRGRSLAELPEVVRAVFGAIPGAESAPCRPLELNLEARPGGGWSARIDVALPGPENGPDSPRGRALRERVTASSVEWDEGEAETVYHIRLKLGGMR